MVRPKRLSASALHVASLCLKRYVAMNVNYGSGVSNNSAAKTGTTVHYALEKFVQAVHIKKEHDWDEDWLIHYLKEGYQTTFQNTDFLTPEYLDALSMTQNWFNTADFTDREVLSVEEKNYYELELSDGTSLPFAYIFDRCDRIISTGQYCVVDYKTNQANVGTDELRKKIQARFYALICQILHPDAKSIRVEFHMLRHGITTVVFTPQDNLDTWNWLLSEVDRILAAPLDPPPTLNKECGFCMVKATCPALVNNINNGGVFSLSVEELVDRKALLDLQSKAARDASIEIENILGPILTADDAPESIDGYEFTARLTVQQVRNVDDELFIELIEQSGDPELIRDYIPRGKITMGLVDKLLRDKNVDPGIKKIVKQLITYVGRDPSVTLERK